MYGLVNRAIEGLIRDRFGDDTWEQILDEANVEEDGFVSLDQYPDHITYDLVGAASKVLDTPAEVLLRAFGTYWTCYVGQQGYGPMMSLDNQSLGQFLSQLDALHTRLAIQMPQLRPPSFTVEHPEPHIHIVHYHSERQGLGPMVVGLLEGLLELKGLTGDVTWLEKKGPGADHDIFRVVETGPRT